MSELLGDDGTLLEGYSFYYVMPESTPPHNESQGRWPAWPLDGDTIQSVNSPPEQVALGATASQVTGAGTDLDDAMRVSSGSFGESHHISLG
jgi:hypothetical protein